MDKTSYMVNKFVSLPKVQNLLTNKSSHSILFVASKSALCMCDVGTTIMLIVPNSSVLAHTPLRVRALRMNISPFVTVNTPLGDAVVSNNSFALYTAQICIFTCK